MRRNLWLGVAIMIIFAISSCGYSMFAGKTTASYVAPDGTQINYSSDKEQNNLEAAYDPVTKAWHIHVDKSGAQESATAAAMQFQAAMLALYSKLADQVTALAAAGAKAGALSGGS